MEKFKVPHSSPTMNKTIRFPDHVISEVEKALVGTGSNFSQFVIAAVQAALNDLNNPEEK